MIPIHDHNIIIGGTGGCAREAYCHSSAANPHRLVTAFFDDVNLDKDQVLGLPVFHDLATITKELNFVVAVGDTRSREALVNKFLAAGFTPSNIISGYVGLDVKFGCGTILCAQAVCTTNIVIGDHCIISHLSSIGHDCVIGDFVTVSALVAISGNVTIGSGTYIGAGASIKEKIKIGKNVVIGMGAVVVADVPDDVVVVGNPAKVLRVNNG